VIASPKLVKYIYRGVSPMPLLIAEEQAAAKHIKALELSEASVRLEGIDPMAYPEYRELRTRVIAGEITSQQAVSILLARYSNVNSKAA
jgi:hypothetical protein